jgi:MYXO-CTERM domain-containing protein
MYLFLIVITLSRSMWAGGPAQPPDFEFDYFFDEAYAETNPLAEVVTSLAELGVTADGRLIVGDISISQMVADATGPSHGDGDGDGDGDGGWGWDSGGRDSGDDGGDSGGDGDFEREDDDRPFYTKLDDTGASGDGCACATTTDSSRSTFVWLFGLSFLIVRRRP